MKYILSILLVFLFSLSYAIGDTAVIKHFTADNGLPSNNVYGVTADNYGYIWFNTDNGVVKYNGYTFKLFTTADELPSNDIWKLFPDKQGRLWVVTFSNKIGYIKDDKYKVVITSKDHMIYPYFMNCDGNSVNFFYGYAGNEKLAKINEKDSVEASSFEIPGKKIVVATISFDNTLVTSVNDSVLYIQDLSKSLKIIDTQKTKFSLWNFTFSYGGGLTYYDHRLIDLMQGYDNIGVVDGDLKSFKKIYFSDVGGEREEAIYTAYKDDSALNIITGKAIYRIGKNFEKWRRIPFTAATVMPFQISYYYPGNLGTEWFATAGDGVLCKFNAYNFFIPDSALAPLFNTTFIGSLNNGSTYWVDKMHKTLYQVNAFGKIRKFIVPKDAALLDRISSKSDSDFYLHASGGTYIFNLKHNTFTSLTDYLSVDTVKRFSLAGEPPVSTDLPGIGYALKSIKGLKEIAKNKWVIFNLRPSVRIMELHNHTLIFKGLDSDRVKDMYYDSIDHFIFFTDLNKITVYNITADKYISLDLQTLNLLKINSVHQLTGDVYSNIYLLDNDKIWMYNVRSQRAMQLKCNFNLSNASIYVFRDYLFIAGKFGIAYTKIMGQLELEDFHFAVNINKYNRIYDFVINSQGIVYMSTDKGFFDFNVNRLTSSQLNGPQKGQMFTLNLSLPFQKQIHSGDTIDINQSASNISLNVINLFGSGNIQYYYRLADDSGWQQASTGDILIGALQADRYYKVRCRLQDNAWVSNEYEFYIYRIPYWWQKKGWIITFWIGGLFVFVIIVLLIILVTRNVVAKANEKRRSLTELELRAVYAQINPHFIFNTLSATQYFINRKEYDSAYVHINKFSRLIRAYLKSSQERYITLSDEIDMLKNYIELQKTRFEDKLEYKIEIDNKVPVKSIQIPSLLLQPLVENAINHGLFHSKDGGLLIIKFIQGSSNDELICIIDDNGIGRSKAKEIKESSAVKHDSYGTKLTRQLIDVFKEFESMGIILEYIDKQLPETGTIVKLTIKNVKYIA